jgi:hypothetical protein
VRPELQTILDRVAEGDYDGAIASCKVFGMQKRESSLAFLMNLAAANFHAARVALGQSSAGTFIGLAEGYIQAAEHQLQKIEKAQK